MERIAAIVEGHTEFHFVRSTYGNSIVQRVIPNGDDVSLALIAEAIVDVLETLGGEIDRVVILLDREGRAVSCQDIASELRVAIAPALGHRTAYVGIADRCIENWILADEQRMRELSLDPDYTYELEGQKGKGPLAALLGFDPAPSDKATLLKSCSALRASQRSASLYDLVGQVDFPWIWTTK